MQPEQICLVAEPNGDLAAARKCRMRTAFIPRPTEHGPNQTTDLRAGQDWDVIAVDIGESAEKLAVKI
jgi:2-haloacid dehalogenase